jgi:hypothetical protein
VKGAASQPLGGGFIQSKRDANPMRTRCERDANTIVIAVPSGSDRVRIAFGVEEAAKE